MPSEHVLRISCGDDEKEIVLINVISVGPAEFDLKLVGTEGTSPYVATVKHSCIQRLRTKHSPVDEADWETVLRGTLLQQRVEGAARGALESIEVTATIAEDQIIVAVRKNTSGITQRLGEVILKKDEDQEIDTITWVSTAVVRSQALEQEVKELQNQFKKQGEVVAKLNEQLQNLIASQTDLKNTLFQKFAASLNKKKLKIRDQQRLLATAKVNQDKASQIESLRNSPASSSPPFAHQDSKKRKPKSDPSMSPSPGTPEESDLDTTSDEL